MKLSFEELPDQVAKLSEEIRELKELFKEKGQVQTQETEKPLNAKECAKFLSISVPTLYSYTQQNKIPFNKKGKRLLFLKSEILEWVKTGRNKTVSEIETETDTYLSNLK